MSGKVVRHYTRSQTHTEDKQHRQQCKNDTEITIWRAAATLTFISSKNKSNVEPDHVRSDVERSSICDKMARSPLMAFF
ncbi:hypothetical protein, partial [Vibrio parahaemolyticus]|uniref:hypothetical protein n=1 Tax=Vibrio parahaemolyticus TaxID=670 RepID=UPI001E4750C0